MICYSYLDMIHDRIIYQLWHGVVRSVGTTSVCRETCCMQSNFCAKIVLNRIYLAAYA
jgi:hypothetical protein